MKEDQVARYLCLEEHSRKPMWKKIWDQWRQGLLGDTDTKWRSQLDTSRMDGSVHKSLIYQWMDSFAPCLNSRQPTRQQFEERLSILSQPETSQMKLISRMINNTLHNVLDIRKWVSRGIQKYWEIWSWEVQKGAYVKLVSPSDIVKFSYDRKDTQEWKCHLIGKKEGQRIWFFLKSLNFITVLEEIREKEIMTIIGDTS